MNDSTFHTVPLFFVRVPARPFTGVPGRPCAFEATTAVADVARVFDDDPHLGLALRLASPSTRRATAAALAAPGEPDLPANLRRTLRKYWIRAHTRATPFGLFAAVGAGHLGGATRVRLGADAIGTVHPRLDLNWVAGAIRGLSAQGADLGVPVRVNPFLHQVGGRVVIANSNVLGESPSNVVDLRATEPVLLVLDAARRGCSREEITRLLVEAYPDVAPDVPRGMLDQLFEQHVLLDHPLPSLAWRTSLGTVLDQVPAPASVPYRADLEQIDRDVESVRTVEDLTALLDDVESRQRDVVPGHEKDTLSVEASLDLTEATLPEQVGTDIARLAEVLVQIGAPRSRFGHLVAYEHAFVERFGAMAEVPLLELLGAERGLGAPPTYSVPPPLTSFHQVESDANRARESVVAELLTTALAAGESEIRLTEQSLRRLAQTVDRTETEPPVSMDLFVSLAPPAPAAEDERIRVIFRDNLADGGRSLSRFVAQLDVADRRAVGAIFEAEARSFPEARTVQLSYFSPLARGANVTRTDVMADLEIAVNCLPNLPEDRQVRLDEILVGATGTGFYLRWARTGERIRVIQPHMLNQSMAPNPLRFVLEASADGIAPLNIFDWGPHAGLPYLPRVSYENLVLSVASWRVTTQDFSEGALSHVAPFAPELAQLRLRRGLPRRVYLAQNDNRLLLDLEDPQDADILRDSLGSRMGDERSVTLEEDLDLTHDPLVRDAQGNGYAAEFVFTVLRTRPVPDRADPASAREMTTKQRLRPGCTAPTAFGLEPDHRWTAVELYGSTRVLDSLVADLPGTMAAYGDRVEQWFFIRYSEDGHHVRLRVRPAAEHDVEVTAHLWAWARGLVSDGLLSRFRVVDYRPEVNRYGGPACLEAAFEVFEASSRYAAALAGCSAEVAALGVETVGTHLVAETFEAAGLLEAMVQIIGEPPSRHPARTQFRAVRSALGALLEPGGRDVDESAARLLAATGDEAALYLHAVRTLASRVAAADAADGLVADPVDVLQSVAHMHLNRSLMLTMEQESGLYSLLAVARRALQQRARALGRSVA